jgi:hypothetical protein
MPEIPCQRYHDKGYDNSHINIIPYGLKHIKNRKSLPTNQQTNKQLLIIYTYIYWFLFSFNDALSTEDLHIFK